MNKSTCTTCGNNCKQGREFCYRCLRKKNKFFCNVCGNKVEKDGESCSKECAEKWGKFIGLKESGKLFNRQEEHSSEDCNHIHTLFDGDILSVWEDGEAVFFSMIYPGITFMMADQEPLQMFLDDLKAFIEYLEGNGD